MKRLLRLLAFVPSALIAGCAADEKACLAANDSAALAQAIQDDFNAYVEASDVRQRKALEDALAAIERAYDLETEAALTAATDSRSTIDADTVRKLMADRAAKRALVSAKRADVLAQLDAERKAWLANPKFKQQDRVNAAIIAYTKARSDLVQFVESLKRGASK